MEFNGLDECLKISHAYVNYNVLRHSNELRLGEICEKNRCTISNTFASKFEILGKKHLN